MNRYLIDSNVLIEANNQYYGAQFCPAFWDWLALRFYDGHVSIIHHVAREASNRDDVVARWVSKNEAFFLTPDSTVTEAAHTIGNWVRSQNFRHGAIREFMDSTDNWLIAYAMAHAYTVVTQEVRSNGVRKVKIPNVCEQFNVPCINTFEMLRIERPMFILQK